MITVRYFNIVGLGSYTYVILTFTNMSLTKKTHPSLYLNPKQTASLIIMKFISAIALLPLVSSTFMAEETLCKCSTQPCPVNGVNSQIIGSNNTSALYTYSLTSGEIPVVQTVTVILVEGDLDHGSGTSQCTVDYARAMETDGTKEEKPVDAGHILAHRLGGPGNAPVNIFPQAQHENRGVYAQFEGVIYDCLSSNVTETPAKSVSLNWEFKYNNTVDTQPNSVVYSTVYEGGECDDLETEFSNTWYA